MTQIKRTNLGKLFLVKCCSFMVRILSIILMFSSLNFKSFGQTSVPFQIQATTYNGYFYYMPSGSYTRDNATWVGFNQPVPDIYYRYRQAEQFNVSIIPAGATITDARIEFYSGTAYGSLKGTIALTGIRSDYQTQTPQGVYSLIYYGTALGSVSISSYQKYSVTSAALKAAVQTAMGTNDHKMGIGAYNTYEFNNGGTDLFDPWLKGTYTIPTPSKPTNLSTYSPTTGSFILQWNAPTGTVTGYKVYKDGVLYNSTASTNIQICGLLPGYSYVMTVIAYNSYGDGTLSDPYTATTHYTSISGNPLICTSQIYSVNEIPSGAIITWSTPSTNISVVSGTEHSNPCTFQKVSNGNGYITATISSSCENYGLSIPVHSGPYSSSDYSITGPSSASCNSYVYYNIPNLAGVTSINWAWPSEWTYVSGQNTAYIALRVGTSSGGVNVGVNNTCGQSGSYAYKFTNVSGCYSLSIYPNPGSDEVTVTILESQAEVADSTVTVLNSTNLSNKPLSYNFIVTDNMGIVYSTFNKKSKSFNISVKNLKNGNYILVGTDGVIKFSSPLIVMH
jgi:hypothetical protein